MDEFLPRKGGGPWLDELRQLWLRNYDFVLVDSRTGVTDSGGVWTVKLPDRLVFVLTANQQNLDGCGRVIAGIHQARLEDPSDPARLLILPVLSRYDGRVETDLADEWLNRCAEVFAPVVGDWLDREVPPLTLLRRIKLPHVPRYTFGEELAVLRDSHDDPERLPYYYGAICDILVSDFYTDVKLLHGDAAAAALLTEEVRVGAVQQQKAALELERLVGENAQRQEELNELRLQRQLLRKSLDQVTTARRYRKIAVGFVFLFFITSMFAFVFATYQLARQRAEAELMRQQADLAAKLLHEREGSVQELEQRKKSPAQTNDTPSPQRQGEVPTPNAPQGVAPTATPTVR